MTSDDERLYYEHESLWTRPLAEREELRLNQTLDLMPMTAASMLDIGAGSGEFIRLLRQRRPLGLLPVSMDVSRAALLAAGNAPAVQASAAALPFRSRSFDIVIACEVIEHLPDAVLASAVAEMARVAALHVVLTVPNREDLRAGTATCPRCRTTFHKNRHHHSFAPSDLSALVPGFAVATISELGPVEAFYPYAIQRLIRRARGAAARLGVCPECGLSDQPAVAAAETASSTPRRPSNLRRLALAPIPRRSRKPWLAAVYERM
ncbi:MAG TPA: class I SAM-dependent methyltransferase [Acidimicrobiales bacterium]|nr:class I SAM-dependent methyltransferase [Acidimicrobiales bacterium]